MMKKIFLAFTFLTLSIVVIPSIGLAQLRYNLEIGKKYGLKQMTTQDITQNIQGMTQNIKNTIGGDISFAIKSKEGNVYTSIFVFETMLFKMESPMFSMSYDSLDENQEENAMNGMFKLIVGHPFEMKFNDKGEVIEVKGFENLMTKVAGSDQASLGAIQESLKGQFSDESMKQSVASMLIVYPEDKPKTGMTWSNSIELNSGMPLESHYNYKITSVNSSVVEIAGEGSMATKEGFAKEQMGMIQYFDLKGDVSVKASVDAKTGWPISITQNQDLDGNVSIESSQLPEPMELPMTIKSVSNYTAL